MTNLIRTLLVLFFMLSNIPLDAQVNEMQYFADTTGGYLDEILDHIKTPVGIIISGKIRKEDSQCPVLMKINTNGEVLWSTRDAINLEGNYIGSFEIKLFEDGFIYGVSNNFDGPEVFKTLWKVNEETGIVSWTKLFHQNSNGITAIEDFDSTTYLISYIQSFKTRLALLDKSNGDTIKTRTFVYSADLDIAIDQNKNIYFSFTDSLIKFNANDFDQIIWKKSYSTLGEIHKIYFDQFDELFIFGHDGIEPHEDPVIKKIDMLTGEQLWSNIAYFIDDLQIADIVSFDGKLYATYQYMTYGGGNDYYRTIKCNKENGVFDWTSAISITPNNEEQAARSIDVDCSGDVYLTGYFSTAGASLTGPAEWGTMKLDNITGERIYDLLITEDSTYYDDLSEGIGICLYGNSPVMVGNLELNAPNHGPRACYVTFNPIDGEIAHKKFIGSGFQAPSITLDIINSNNSMFVLKQQGTLVKVERYDSLETLVWQKIFSDTNILHAGQFSITNDFVYLSVTRPKEDSIAPYYTSETEKFELFKLDKGDGEILDSDSLNFSSVTIIPFDIEADNDSMFVFYLRNDSIFYRRWNNSTLSGEQFLEQTGNNMTYEGKINIILNNNTLLALGRNALYSIDKNTLNKSEVFNYSTSRDFYDINIFDNKLVLSGSDLTGAQVMTVINGIDMTLLWEESYGANGAFYRTIFDSSGNIYAMGVNNNNMGAYKISRTDGELVWSYFPNIDLFPQTIPFDIEMIETKNCIVLAGTSIQNSGSSDALISLLDLSGDTIINYLRHDELSDKSFAFTASVFSDTSFWVGGALNTITWSKRGFVYAVETEGEDVTVDNRKMDSFIHLGAYPNPTNGNIYLSGLDDGPINYTLYDLTGRICETKVNSVNKYLNISHLSDGIYLLKVIQNKQFGYIKIQKIKE